MLHFVSPVTVTVENSRVPYKNAPPTMSRGLSLTYGRLCGNPRSYYEYS